MITKYNYITIFIKVILLFFTLNSGFTQEFPDTLSDGELFQMARNSSFAGDTEKARQICTVILEKSPELHDVSVLFGQTLAWDKLYDSARTVLKKVLQKEPGHRDAIYTLTSVEIWKPCRSFTFL